MIHAIANPSLEIFFATLFCGVALVLFALILSDYLLQTQTWRDGPRRRFLGSRLRKMLTLRLLEPGTYLQATSTSSLELHLSICGDCSKLKDCDAASRNGGADNFSFCPNGTMIDRLLRNENGKPATLYLA